MEERQRFKLAGRTGADCPLPYLAVYEAEGDDATSIIDSMNNTRAQREQGHALNRGTGRIWVFKELVPKPES